MQKGIEIDNQHGISSKFTRALQDFDKKTGKPFPYKKCTSKLILIGASTRAEAVDKQYDITTKVTQSAHSAWSGLSSYYEKFSGTAPGLRLHQFYQQGNKQVQDIHQEALRLSGLKKQESASGHTSQTVGAVEQGLKKAEDTLSSAKSTELGPQSVTGKAKLMINYI